MTYTAAMDIPTKAELARLLQSVNVRELAAATQLSEKTIYRYRWGKSSPGLDDLAAVVSAAKALKAKGKRATAKAA